MSDDAPSKERRSQRIFTALPIRWLRPDSRVEAIATSVNADGMFICTTEAPPHVGSLIQLEVDLPDGDAPARLFVTVRFAGRRTVSGDGIGVELHLLGDDERRRWNDYYEALRRRTAWEPR